MKIKKIIIFVVIITFLFVSISCESDILRTKGLIGIYYSEPDLTSIKGVSVLKSLDQKWDDSVDYEGGTSGVWNGYIIAPATGEIVFHLKTNKQLELKINSDSINVNGGVQKQKLTIQMEDGKAYPINILFLNPGEHEVVGWFNIEWSWEGHAESLIPLSNLYYTEKESREYDFLNDIENGKLDSSNILLAKGKNVIVYYKPGRFAAWPANSGIWNWGNEILVGFTLGYYRQNNYHHSLDRHKPALSVFARSVDGGNSWVLDDTTTLNNATKVRTNKSKINYAAPGFALRNNNSKFYYSYDKGKKWNGPFRYPNLGVGELTSRTDYLVENQNECLIFMSAKVKKVRASLQDRAMCVKTTDGGLSFNFVSWMTELDTIRSVMPATVRIDKDHLVSAMRRRLDPPKNIKNALPKNWIDIYESLDNGISWKFMNKIAYTDNGIRNGNPSSMVKTKSGFLCVIYGYRVQPYGIRAKVSKDNGRTWSKEIILRDDAITWDIGYLRSVVNEEDAVVSVYYFSTKERPEQHIEATIWYPSKIIGMDK